jgi:ankyrin repeat protein
MDNSIFLTYPDIHHIIDTYSLDGKEGLECLTKTLLSKGNINKKIQHSENSLLTYLLYFGPHLNAHNLFKVLINDYFADVNLVNNKGDTVLIIASRINNMELVEFLINEGADTNITNKCGCMFLDYIKEENKSKVLDLLYCNIKPGKRS